MLNLLRAPIGKAINPLGKSLADAGVTPDMITVAGTVGATAAALIAYPRGDFFVGTLFIWAFVMFDMVDGAVARAGGLGTRFGAVLDSSCDRIADSAVFGSLAWWFARHDQPALLLATLLCLVLGSLTSYVKARAEGAGFTCNVGIAERSERLIVVLVGTGLSDFPGLHVPYVQAIALWLLVAASTVTVGQRFATVWRQSRVAA
ncbi:MAG TPA: CDP-alcohol phosphatidyltransferase family protein [Jatrophihabitans sp.]|nr:CDP-alcohol phosphatidyltransferase family protein [Jatrophihabitans sp.]